ncbi:hypothetical protein ACJX0J_019770, partial [Zea mays]
IIDVRAFQWENMGDSSQLILTTISCMVGLDQQRADDIVNSTNYTLSFSIFYHISIGNLMWLEHQLSFRDITNG